MTDLYANTTPGLSSPAVDGTMIVPSDAGDLSHVTRAVYVGTGGTISAQLASGAMVTMAGVPGGSLLPLRIRKVMATGTTAGQMVAFW
ncbi:hypothetical protein DKT77_01595 [Meridianimarinicoccus roseus]|uniref:Uncharacterized protein n=1 Tax=Meridianimarinicoccus roseus TaxID=2072018 RepID=A0A2V2LMX5_9RHOB|nr:hypothetical protein [Meridianimarinicoccus roseus]PWR04397.1 hypothetical protein DKT77_01595 [Meridianimarinicoccus roseus]